MAERICLTEAVLLAGDHLDLLRDAALTIEGERILSLDGHIPAGAEAQPLPGRLICPMFVDAHCHLGDTGAKDMGIGLPLEQVVNPPHGLKHRFLSQVSPEQHILQMRHGLLEMLSNGVIACADFREQGLRGVNMLRQAARELPIRVRILGRMGEGQPDQDAEAEAHELLHVADGLGVRDIECYDPQALVRLRRAYPHKLFALHAAENRQAEQASWQATGMGQARRALAWDPDFIVHLVHTAPAELAELARRHVIGVACPRSNAVLGDGQPDLPAWKQAGLSFALGSDNVMFCAPDMLREMDFASRLLRGRSENAAALPPVELLTAATIHGARALKLEDDLGSLAPGKEASFVVFNFQTPNLRFSHDLLNSLVHRATPEDIESIYIRGQRYERAHFLSQARRLAEDCLQAARTDPATPGHRPAGKTRPISVE
ncbi:MAG: amidohydrolase family protein [Anaerolineaceae bacterium]|nr:amidohydrolase family protein [Anaerolineaceae bacterium]